MHEPASSRLAVSRPLLLGWCLWLLVSWSINLWLYPARRTWMVEPDGSLLWRAPAEAFVPMVRGMLLTIGVGMLLAWPALRLGRRGHAHAGRDAATELAALWLVAQVVIWPLRLLSGFPVERLGLISLALGVWGLAVGVIVWLGLREGSSMRRAVAMAGCVALALGAWPLAWAWRVPAVAEFSPLQMLWSLGGSAPDDGRTLPRLVAVAGVACAVWLAALVGGRRRAYDQSPCNVR